MDIFELPRARSVNVIGTSATAQPARTARQVVSIWKAYPWERVSHASIRSRTGARNARNPAVVSWTGRRSTVRT
ncbi:hypothetical protein [Solicola sp. PLA-1-18]|uniref:hypothetical protein n=1 Tax=Solicola sp. PLA-1-18 TaxID=3380532 RepID=UPI003B7AA65C